MFSAACRMPFASASSSSSTTFGSPANRAGRKNPVANPTTPASATSCAGPVVNGSATNTAQRSRSDATISLRREKRSTKEPEQQPDDDHRDEVGDEERRNPLAGVRAVPDVDHQRHHRETRPEPRADGREEEQPEVARASDQGELAAGHGLTLVQGSTGRRPPPGARPALAAARTRPSASSSTALSSGDPTVTRIALGAPKPSSGRTITPARSSASNSGRAVLFPALGVDEVRDRRAAHSKPWRSRISTTRCRSCAFTRRRRSTSASSSRLATAATCACVLRSNARRTFPIAATTERLPTPHPTRRPASP